MRALSSTRADTHESLIAVVVIVSIPLAISWVKLGVGRLRLRIASVGRSLRQGAIQHGEYNTT